MGRTILWGTLVAGTLDILSAFVWSAMLGGSLAGILPSVASGPFGENLPDSAATQGLGLIVHFAIMAVMATVYVIASRRIPTLNRHWLMAGLLYGLALWLVMYWIVLPLRFAGFHHPSALWPIVRQLISHCLLVGLPIAWISANRSPERRAV